MLNHSVHEKRSIQFLYRELLFFLSNQLQLRNQTQFSLRSHFSFENVQKQQQKQRKQGHMQFFAAKEQRTVLNKSSLTQLVQTVIMQSSIVCCYLTICSYSGEGRCLPGMINSLYLIFNQDMLWDFTTSNLVQIETTMSLYTRKILCKVGKCILT